MAADRIRRFTERFLTAHGCHFIEKSPNHLITQLSIEADKDLVHRPFYWMYVEKMGIEPQPSILTFVFDPQELDQHDRGECLNPGSPRFLTMLEAAKKRGRFVRLFEESARPVGNPLSSRPYIPWLGVNFQVSYVCDQKKDVIHCLGINLHSGEIMEDFFREMKRRRWNAKLPANRHTIQPQLRIAEGVGELERFLQTQIERQDMTWAKQALKRMRIELEQLEHFFPEGENNAEKEQRIRETIWQYHPRVEVEVINAGLFYLEAL
ncbi:MAG: YqhG family protein [Planifilum sp.]|jgi:hypothetical protein